MKEVLEETEKRKILSLKTRKKIYSTILSQPGICIRELERTTNISIGNLVHHIFTLLDAKLIKEDADGFFRRFYPLDMSERKCSLISLLRRDAARRVIPFFIDNKTVTINELSNNLKISKSTAHWHIQRLKKNNMLLERVKKNQGFYSLIDRKAVEKLYKISCSSS